VCSWIVKLPSSVLPVPDTEAYVKAHEALVSRRRINEAQAAAASSGFLRFSTPLEHWGKGVHHPA
jgi:hypothetical protein